ncbi:MAG: bifunctional hydroxymethylpyrimidine kinase/phosphomethylpyrimidine kinase [Desulfobulbaceae bacterium]|uniref:hydroxymethylpyrimidine kinase n=1 Tax=Candidatus Desulfobia pelagia TaxID=2841692 RepID=A0A8J6NC16_9BACT|nr:bifunctional hydroxymethylpyrimidine kinase/phosphomethylpyrimidine kinase [Candidatus Desulfobia pelagia]
MIDQLPIALTIAGSDPSGGAGIQADLKTFSAIGVYGAAAITSLTIQNTMGVSGCYTLNPDVVRQQITCVLNDMHVTHVKIGMTGSSEVAETIADALDGFTGEVIYDPVRISSSGADLMSGEDGMTAWKKLISRATVLTPNRDELEQLAGNRFATTEQALEAAGKIMEDFPHLRVLCLTGGHFQTKKSITDSMIKRISGSNGEVAEPFVSTMNHDRIETKNLHGTGCTFASAFTAFHMETQDDTAAFTRASQFVYKLIRASTDKRIGHGTGGPLVHHLWSSWKDKK